MNLVDISIKRPTLIACLVIVMIALGWKSMRSMGVDLFPNVTFPYITVSTPYPGAGPAEIETLVSRPLEDELSSISGVKRINSISREGVSIVFAEFSLETDVKYAEQQVRDRAASAKRRFPSDVKDPVVRRLDPGDQPVMVLSVEANLGPADLYDLANETIRPRLEQVPQVGLVEVIGGRKREIQVELDRRKLKSHEISASQVASRIGASGQDVPVGKITEGTKELVFRTLGQFKSLNDVKNTIVNFFGSDVPVNVGDVGTVVDGIQDETSRVFVNGKQSLFIFVFRQSGSNTIAVADGVGKSLAKINAQLAEGPNKGAEIKVVRDGSKWVRDNVTDVNESIILGVLLAVIVVYYFLGNGRSTIITGLALPNSLIGAFILMAAAGFTVNMMTLLALSLAVGLLVDDAIVVRENIFRHIEMGKSPEQAAREGTREVQLAVIATTLTVLAVFGPVAFLKGVVGQFFTQFGLTICFAMLISLFDALTVAPMLSAYFAGKVEEEKNNLWTRTVGRSVKSFSRFQDRLEDIYERTLQYTTRHPIKVLAISFLIFVASIGSIALIPKTFLPPQDQGEFSVTIELPPGTSLAQMSETALKVDEAIRSNPEVAVSALTVGDRDGQSNVSEYFVRLVPSKNRKANTSQVKERLREQLKAFSRANPVVKDYDAIGGGLRPYTLNIVGNDQKELETYALKAFEILRKYPGLVDVDTSLRTGKPEFQVAIDPARADKLGVSNVTAGMELRAQIEGVKPAKFRIDGKEYDVRVRLRDDQRDLKTAFHETYVPNINYNLVHVRDVANGTESTGPVKITRQNRSRYIQISADVGAGGGLGDAMAYTAKILKEEVKLPAHMSYTFIGQAENMQELNESMVTAVIFGTLFVFLILASLYESFVTPLTIMLALPLAMSGAFLALAITRESLNIFSMIGGILLLGVATKNSILLVDYANQLVRDGMERAPAMVRAGRTRLRPILMTTMALIAGTIPVALGLNEASRQRTSMGIAIIGGLISSTLLTLVVVPAAWLYIDRFRVWSKTRLGALAGAHGLEKSHDNQRSEGPRIH